MDTYEIMDRKIEVLNYIRERYMEEQSRFKHFEDKCSKLVTSLTIVIAAFCGIVGFKSSTILSPCTELQWINLFVCCFAFFALVCAWGHSILALKIGDCPIAAKSRENAEYLLNAEENDAIEQIFDCYVNTTQELHSVIDKKSINLKHAYNELIIGASLVVAFITLTVIMEILK